jgi:hypothetical protein
LFVVGILRFQKWVDVDILTFSPWQPLKLLKMCDFFINILVTLNKPAIVTIVLSIEKLGKPLTHLQVTLYHSLPLVFGQPEVAANDVLQESGRWFLGKRDHHLTLQQKVLI